MDIFLPKDELLLLASQLENADDKPNGQNEKVDISIEQEIECPRCHDFMTLHSEFDRLGYLCEECDFSLHLSHLSRIYLPVKYSWGSFPINYNS